MRLPRDWLGPREELVPFGPGAAPPEMPDSPPTAADFWGERSASIHDAFQAAPDDDADAPPQPRAGLSARARRRAAVAAGLALAVVTSVAVALGLSRPASREASGSRVDMAAVLSSSLSRVLERSLAQVNVRTTSSQMVVAQHRGPVDRGPPQDRPVVKPRARPVVKRVYETARHQSTPPATYAASASADVAPAPPVTATHQPTLSAATSGSSETNTGTTRPASPSVSSHASSSPRAAVSPTGESGALGPVQSPNG